MGIQAGAAARSTGSARNAMKATTSPITIAGLGEGCLPDGGDLLQ